MIDVLDEDDDVLAENNDDLVNVRKKTENITIK
jgi:hypothetical protein